nr:MAG TPA: hypothetical protein [Bacteriophage sp.]
MENLVLRLYARSNFATSIVLSVEFASDSQDLTPVIYEALEKLSSYSTPVEKFVLQHIEVTNLKFVQNYGNKSN